MIGWNQGDTIKKIEVNIMKEIKAYVRPHQLSKVVMALHGIKELSGLAVTKVQGFGRGHEEGASNRIVEDLVEYVPYIKIEICCNDDIADIILSTIQENAYTGLKGDGKIFVSDITTAVRISTGERDSAAL
jgi:nitrogen regulatory protein P-II 1